MMDNHTKAMALMRKMEKQLPLLARPTKALIQFMQQNGIEIEANQKLRVESVLDLGDEGGIGCEVRLSQQQENPIIVSLTHLRVMANYPLKEEILAYQIARTKKLKQENRNSQPYQFTLKPDGKNI